MRSQRFLVAWCEDGDNAILVDIFGCVFSVIID